MYVVDSLDKGRVEQMSNLIVDPKNLNIYIRSKSFEGKPEVVPIED